MAKTKRQKVSRRKPNAKNRTKYFKIVEETTQRLRALKQQL